MKNNLTLPAEMPVLSPSQAQTPKALRSNSDFSNCIMIVIGLVGVRWLTTNITSYGALWSDNGQFGLFVVNLHQN